MTDEELDQRLRERLLSEEVDTCRVAAAVRSRIRQRRHIPRWAAVSVLAAGILLLAFLWPRPPQVCVAAAQDHEREIVNGEPRRWLSDVSEIDSLAEKEGLPVSAVAALATTGYHLERGRLCFLNRQIFLHLVYTGNGGQYSVYLRPLTPEAAFTSSVQGTEKLAYFQTRRVTAVIVSRGANAQAFARASLHSLTAVAL